MHLEWKGKGFRETEQNKIKKQKCSSTFMKQMYAVSRFGLHYFCKSGDSW